MKDGPKFVGSRRAGADFVGQEGKVVIVAVSTCGDGDLRLIAATTLDFVVEVGEQELEAYLRRGARAESAQGDGVDSAFSRDQFRKRRRG